MPCQYCGETELFSRTATDYWKCASKVNAADNFERSTRCRKAERDRLKAELEDIRKLYDIQRNNFTELSEAVIGDGSIVGWPDPVALATEARTSRVALQTALRNLVGDIAPILHELNKYNYPCDQADIDRLNKSQDTAKALLPEAK